MLAAQVQTTDATGPPPAAAPQTTTTATPAADPTQVTVSSAELAALRAGAKSWNDYQTQTRQADAAKEADRLRTLAAQGDSKKVFDELTEKHKKTEDELSTKATALQTKLYSALTTSTLAKATVGVVWASEDAAEDGLAKLESKFEVVVVDGVETVREKVTGRPVETVVAEAIKSDQFAHLLDAGFRGKGGLGTGNQASPTALPGAAKPWNEVELMKQAIAARKAQQQGQGLYETKGWG